MNEVPVVDCQIEGDEWTISIKGAKDSTFKFRFGVEIKRTTGDGRHVTVRAVSFTIQTHFLVLCNFYYHILYRMSFI